MRIMLVGKYGQLGWELERTCATLGEVVCIDYPDIDLSEAKSTRETIQRIKPDLIINAAAYTNVDKAESEPELVRRVNAFAPKIMAEELKKLNGALIHYSTDYVFDGTKGSSYVESDQPNPLNIYGSTKLEGEQFIKEVSGSYLILRTSWVYSLNQGGFVSKVMQWARQEETLRIVDDQIGSPTSARMLAEATSQLIAQGRMDKIEYIRENTGLYHLAGGGACSRFEWAEEILELDPKKEEHFVKNIQPAKSNDFSNPANRPLNTSLDSSIIKKIFELDLPEWKKSMRLLLL
jgi:dTDP-4-dehydrorhamnose reductase